MDTVLALYAIGNVGDLDTWYIRADGVAPISEAMAGAGTTPRVNSLCLATFSDNMARAGIPVTGAVDFDCEFGTYNAVVDAWGPAGIAAWEELPLGGIGTKEGVVLRELPGGNVVAGYRDVDETAYVFGLFDGIIWNSEPSDQVNCKVSPADLSGENERAVDFEPNSLGEIWFPTVYGSFSPVVYSGEVGDLNTFDPFYINIEPKSCSTISLAMDDADTLHFAWQRPYDGMLVYSTLEAGEMTAEQVVDLGAEGSALAFGPAAMVADGDTLHVFHNDLAHGQMVYSRNFAGVWQVEQQPILPKGQFPYVVTIAGLLEDTGKIYCGYYDYLSRMWRVVVSDPSYENWDVFDITPITSEYHMLADNGTSIAGLYYKENTDTASYELFIDVDVNIPGSKTTELVSSDEDLIRNPLSLAFNKFDDSWYLAANDGDLLHALLFHRVAPETWQGPFLIDEQTTGVNAELAVFGLACRNSDGQLSAMVREFDDGSTNNRISILSSGIDPISFGSKVEIGSVDTAVFESNWTAHTKTNSSGELALKLTRQLLGDPAFDVLMFTEEGGVWDFVLWDTPVTKQAEWITPGYAITGSGLPAATLVEFDSDEPLYGRAFVYYPW